MADFKYTLERQEIEADDNGDLPSQFFLTCAESEERLFLGRSALAKGGNYKHNFGWSSASPGVRRFLNENVRYRQNDIVVATFPKCGTTLTEQVVLLLLNGGDASALDPLSKNSANLTGGFGKVWPEACLRCDSDIAAHDGTGPEEFLPKSPVWFASLPEPRVIKTHARVPELLGAALDSPIAPLQTGAKYIVCTRNPLDACVSCYYHAWNPAKNGWPFAAWVEAWLQSDEHAGYGSWHTWHKHWWALHQQHSDMVLWLSYEEMLADPAREVRRIADHMGVAADDALIERVVAGSAFDSMKAAAVSAASASKRNNTDLHLRAGKACKWKEHFYAGGILPEDSERLVRLVRTAFEETLGGSGLKVLIGDDEKLS